MGKEQVRPDTVLGRQFIGLANQYPGATLVAVTHPQGNYRLTVPGCRLPKPAAFNQPTATLMSVLPIGYPQAAPDAFYFQRGLLLSHGGFVPTAVDREGDFDRFYAHILRWNPNTDTLLTVVNFMRQTLSFLADEDQF